MQSVYSTASADCAIIVICNIVVVNVLTLCALLHSMNDFKAIQMTMQRSWIREFMLYEFKLGDNIAEATKNICFSKGKNQRTVSRWLKKFCSGCKNFEDPARSVRPKPAESKVVLQAIEVYPASFIVTNPTSCPQRVSGELAISQSSVVRQFHGLNKSIQYRRIELYVNKILGNIAK